MRLRTYILIISVATIGFVIAILNQEAQKTLKKGFNDLGNSQVEQTTRYIQAIIKSKKEFLEHFRYVVSADSEIAKWLNFSEQSGDEYWVYSRINQLRERSQFDLIDIVYPDGSFLQASDRMLGKRLYDFAKRPNNHFLILQFSGKITLLSLANPSNSKSGILVLGYFLDEKVQKRISDLTGSRVSFYLQDNDSLHLRRRHEVEMPPGEFEVYPFPDQTLIARVFLDRTIIDRISQGMRRNLFSSGIESLLILMLLLYFFLEFGFVRRFKALLSGIEEASRRLDSGIISHQNVTTQPIQELSALSHTFGRFAESIRSYDHTVKEQAARAAASEKQAALTTLAQQTAHDIRSPLATLEMFMDSLSNLPDDVRTMMRTCVTRIADVANGLLEKSRLDEVQIAPEKDSETTPTDELISLLIESILSEKRIQLGPKSEIHFDLSVGPKDYGLFVKVEPTEFRRVISNLLDNAIEALSGGPGSISVSVRSAGDFASVKITDTGAGIPETVLPTLGERGKSFGKKSGSGLGLYYAKERVNAWNGEFKLSSIYQKGTTVEIVLPRCEAPEWFVPRLLLPDDCVVVVLDDDRSVHHLWEERFRKNSSSEHGVKILSFERAGDLLAWHRTNDRPVALYLCDLDLRDKSWDGLKVIEALHAWERAVLVTSRSEDPKVKGACVETGIRLLPKPLAARVPIVWLRDFHSPARALS